MIDRRFFDDHFRVILHVEQPLVRQQVVAVVGTLPIQKEVAVELPQSFFIHLQDAVRIEQAVGLLVQEDLAGLQVVDVVAEFLQVARDVRADQDAALRVGDEVVLQHVQDFVARADIESTRGFVENQQLRPVRQRRQRLQLGLHPGREFLQFLILRQVEISTFAQEIAFVEFSVKTFQQPVDVLYRIDIVKKGFRQHGADAFAVRQRQPGDVLPVDFGAARCDRDQAQQRFEKRRFAGAVFPD